MRRKKILFIVGPTASSKTEFAISLAKKINGCIISADSMQVYKEMNIGTAKPSLKQRSQIAHYLIDLIPPTRNFSVYEYRKLALSAINETIEKGHFPIVVGGSGLYIQSLIRGLSEQAPGNTALRKKLSLAARKRGLKYLYARLKAIDRQSAKKIHPNDKKRLIRALEIYELTGKTKSQWEKKTESLTNLGFSFKIIGIRFQRENLYQRIETRIDQMMKNGLLNEVRTLSKRRLSKTARQSLSYREFLAYLKKQITLDDAVKLLKRNTRNYAKRQLTWFRHEKGIRWIDADGKSTENICRKIKSDLKDWI